VQFGEEPNLQSDDIISTGTPGVGFGQKLAPQ
jgi:hypothetical protein